IPVSATTPADNSAPNAPVTFNATAVAVNQVDLAWTSGGGFVDHYQIERSFNAGAYQSIGTSATAAYSDRTAAAGITYLYRVRAVSSTGAVSNPSNIDL